MEKKIKFISNLKKKEVNKLKIKNKTKNIKSSN